MLIFDLFIREYFELQHHATRKITDIRPEQTFYPVTVLYKS
jgi:hypothetical protein